MSDMKALAGVVEQKIRSHFNDVVDPEKMNYTRLARACLDEWTCGFRGDVLECLGDLNDTVGLREWMRK